MLAPCMLRGSLIVLVVLGFGTMKLNQLGYSVICLMISSLSKCSNSAVMAFLVWKGTFRIGCWTGEMFLLLLWLDMAR